jgi:hypothetical protein
LLGGGGRLESEHALLQTARGYFALSLLDLDTDGAPAAFERGL